MWHLATAHLTLEGSVAVSQRSRMTNIIYLCLLNAIKFIFDALLVSVTFSVISVLYLKLNIAVKHKVTLFISEYFFCFRVSASLVFVV